MSTKSLGKIGRQALLISPLAIAPFAFIALLHWLKSRDATLVMVLSAVFAISVLGYTSLLARKAARRMDEVQIASQGFISFRGYIWGAGVTLLLLMLPPLTNRLIDLAEFLTAGAPDMTTRHRIAVLLGLNFGFMLLVIMQMVCMIVASVIWQRRMGGRPEQQ